MRGTGLARGKPLPLELGEPLAGRSDDLDALAAYCNSLEPTLSPHADGPGKLGLAAERGRVLFESPAVGCAGCHSGPMYTDSRLDAKPFRTHDVGTGRGDPAETLGPAFDTPTLVGVYRTAPYLHDGRARTLRDVLTTHNAGDRHGGPRGCRPGRSTSWSRSWRRCRTKRRRWVGAEGWRRRRIEWN